MSFFRNFAYRVRVFFENRYFFNTRDFSGLYYDDKIGKWKKGSKFTAKEALYRWFEGEQDLLNVMELKLTHIFYKLRKDGIHAYCYLNAYSFCNDSNTKEERNWALHKSLDKIYNRSVAEKESFSDYFETKEKGQIVEWSSKVFLGNESVDKSISDSGKRHYYIKHRESIEDDFGTQTDTEICCYVDKLIPSEKIPKKYKLYTMPENIEDAVNKKWEEAPQYKEVFEKNILHVPNFYTVEKIEMELKLLDCPIADNFYKNLVQYQQTFDVTPKDFKNFSPELMKNLRGKRQGLHEILIAIKKIRKIQNLDWISDKLSIDNYMKKRHELYRDLADWLAENAHGWWD